mmetsp:Transcript_30353/g.75396  ORF Transcript_30353/g.75396 Transcript_30353/m.75396 type:complete len:126 (+) Transcript_30353:99-476(+)
MKPFQRLLSSLNLRPYSMGDLERRLVEAKDARVRLIATDGVFSMDGTVAPLKDIVRLARKHDAIVFVDECHATGFVGPTGRGAAELDGVLHDARDILIINGTLVESTVHQVAFSPRLHSALEFSA